MTLPDEVNVDVADGLVVLQVRDNTVRLSPSASRAVAEALDDSANEIDPAEVLMQSEPGA